MALRAERVAPLAGDDATVMEQPAVVELGSGAKRERVALVAFTGTGEERKLRVTREGESAQLIVASSAGKLFEAEYKDFLSALADDEHDHGHDHVHEHEHGH